MVGRVSAMIFGQQGHGVTVRASHLLKQSAPSTVCQPQVASPGPSLEGKFSWSNSGSREVSQEQMMD